MFGELRQSGSIKKGAVWRLHLILINNLASTDSLLFNWTNHNYITLFCPWISTSWIINWPWPHQPGNKKVIAHEMNSGLQTGRSGAPSITNGSRPDTLCITDRESSCKTISCNISPQPSSTSNIQKGIIAGEPTHCVSSVTQQGDHWSSFKWTNDQCWTSAQTQCVSLGSLSLQGLSIHPDQGAIPLM